MERHLIGSRADHFLPAVGAKRVQFLLQVPGFKKKAWALLFRTKVGSLKFRLRGSDLRAQSLEHIAS